MSREPVIVEDRAVWVLEGDGTNERPRAFYDSRIQAERHALAGEGPVKYVPAEPWDRLCEFLAETSDNGVLSAERAGNVWLLERMGQPDVGANGTSPTTAAYALCHKLGLTLGKKSWAS